MTAPDNASDVLSAVRLGWYLAEVRGRNRPGGPPGAMNGLPDHADHALPLRVERGPTELRIEAQAVIAKLATDLGVDDRGDGTSFGKTLDDVAKLLAHARAPKASAALRRVSELLQPPAGQGSTGKPGSGTPGSGTAGSGAGGSGTPSSGAAGPGTPSAGAAGPGTPSAGAAVPAGAEQAAHVLEAALARQLDVAAGRAQAATAAEQVLATAVQALADAAHQPAPARSAAAADRAAAKAAVLVEQAAAAGEQDGVMFLRQAIAALRQAIAASPATAAQVALGPIRAGLHAIATASQGPWENLAELIWQFDAHIQDVLAATSETQACGYQLGRGLSETYWALDPGRADGSQGWSFLLGTERCAELSRLVGRLAAYMAEYTAPAIAGSVEVWHDVAATPSWRGDDQDAGHALYRQIRRWYELVILGQDPTTLIGPFNIITNYRTVGRAIRLFWPQLAATIVGLVFLGALLISLSIGTGTSLERTVSGVLAAAGLSLAGITGTIKNSAQAMLKRLRQDGYTELVAIAVLTAPQPPRKTMMRQAISRRGLTPATPN